MGFCNDSRECENIYSKTEYNLVGQVRISSWRWAQHQDGQKMNDWMNSGHSGQNSASKGQRSNWCADVLRNRPRYSPQNKTNKPLTFWTASRWQSSVFTSINLLNLYRRRRRWSRRLISTSQSKSGKRRRKVRRRRSRRRRQRIPSVKASKKTWSLVLIHCGSCMKKKNLVISSPRVRVST